MSSSLDAELVVDLDRLDELAPAWDALAVANANQLASPAWMQVREGKMTLEFSLPRQAVSLLRISY